MADRQYSITKKKILGERRAIHLSSFASSQFIASVISQPFQVIGVLLQLSNKANEGIYGETSTAVSKLQIAKSYEIAVKEQRYNELTLASGVTRNNRPFQAPIYLNYREALKATAAQGYQGFYKGNLLEIFLSTFKYGLGTKLSDRYENITGRKSFLIDFIAYLIIDIAMHPLRNCQTRFILQNRLPQFATYKSVLSFQKKTHFREMYQGWKVYFPLNFIQSMSYMAVINFNQQPENSIYALLVSFITVYPFYTVQRRLEAQSVHHSMFPRVYLGMIHAFQEIYKKEGVFNGFYRGFWAIGASTIIRAMVFPYCFNYIDFSLEFNRFRNSGADLL